MIHSSRFAAVLDACVLYPVPVRDLLLHLASFELYTPKWTDQIHEEWKRTLLKNRTDLKAEQLDRTIREMKKAFPDANVERYELLIFISNVIDLNPEKSRSAFLQQVSFLKNPPMTELQVLESLKKCGLVVTSERLRTK